MFRIYGNELHGNICWDATTCVQGFVMNKSDLILSILNTEQSIYIYNYI